jgi:hypothetical protein
MGRFGCKRRRFNVGLECYTIANPSFPFSFFLGQRTEQTVQVGNTMAPYDLILVPSPSYFLPTQIIPWTCNPAGAICNITPSDTVTPNGSPVHLQMTVTVPEQDRLSLGGTFSFTALAQELITGGNSYGLTGTPFTIHVQDYALEVPSTQFVLVPGIIGRWHTPHLAPSQGSSPQTC